MYRRKQVSSFCIKEVWILDVILSHIINIFKTSTGDQEKEEETTQNSDK